MEKYSCYEFEIKEIVVENGKGFIFLLYTAGCPPYDDGIIDSDEWYDTEQEARFAAIGYITTLENGPDDPNYDYGPETIDWNARRELGE